jgi:hypothetical protein
VPTRCHADAKSPRDSKRDSASASNSRRIMARRQIKFRDGREIVGIGIS